MKNELEELYRQLRDVTVKMQVLRRKHFEELAEAEMLQKLAEADRNITTGAVQIKLISRSIK